MLLALLLSGCWLLKKDPEPVPADCAVRAAFYADEDGDGHGDALNVNIGCEAPTGWVTTADDCDDANAAVWDTCGADTSGDTSGDTGNDTSGDTSGGETGS